MFLTCHYVYSLDSIIISVSFLYYCSLIGFATKRHVAKCASKDYEAEYQENDRWHVDILCCCISDLLPYIQMRKMPYVKINRTRLFSCWREENNHRHISRPSRGRSSDEW